MKSILIKFALVAAIASVANADQILFNDDFSNGLSMWSVPGHGQIVADPLDSSNSALVFTATAAGGDMWSVPVTVTAESRYLLSFRYLGNAGGADTGGYLWLSDPMYGWGYPCPTFGTQTTNTDWELIDDGQWHAYELNFAVADWFNPMSGSLQIVVEDWNGAAGTDPPPNIAGDALFDDIRLVRLDPVPTESASWSAIKSLFE